MALPPASNLIATWCCGISLYFQFTHLSGDGDGGKHNLNLELSDLLFVAEISKTRFLGIEHFIVHNSKIQVQYSARQRML